MLRECRGGYKIGSLFADTPDIAAALCRDFAARAAGLVNFLDLSEANPATHLFRRATRTLDNITQQIMATALARLDVTRVVITHRLPTVINADRIYVMDCGHDRIAHIPARDNRVFHVRFAQPDLAARQVELDVTAYVAHTTTRGAALLFSPCRYATVLTAQPRRP